MLCLDDARSTSTPDCSSKVSSFAVENGIDCFMTLWGLRLRVLGLYPRAQTHQTISLSPGQPARRSLTHASGSRFGVRSSEFGVQGRLVDSFKSGTSEPRTPNPMHERDARATNGLLLAFSAAISKGTPVMEETQSGSELCERRHQKGLGDGQGSHQRLFSQRSGGNQ